MNRRVMDSNVLKQLRSVVGWEEENYEPAPQVVNPQTSVEEGDLGKDVPYPFPFVDLTKDFLLSTLGGSEAGSSNAYLHEKKQKLFKHARDKDQREECNLGDLRAELRGLTPVQVTFLCRSRDERDNTALHYAAKAGNLDICKLLQRRGADINAKGQNKMKPLQFAARYGDEKRASDVWDCMEWIIAEYGKHLPPGNIQQGGKKGDKEIFFDVREKDKYDFSILHHAIQNTNWEENPIVVRNLIKTGKFSIKEADKQGNTSLHLATQFDKQENHKILDVFFGNENIPPDDIKDCLTAKNNVGMTPLHVACAVGNADSVNQLLDAGWESGITVTEIINTPDNNGALPISLAITSKNLNMMEVLIEKGAIVDEETILAAARTGDVKIMEKLISSKDAVDSNGEKHAEKKTQGTTPLFIAAQHNHKDMVKFLMKAKHNERTSDMNGVTPLMIAIKEGNIDIVNNLLDDDSVQEKDNEDKNVFHYAFQSRKPKELTTILKDFIHLNFTSNCIKKLMDLLTDEDLNDDTPFHILARRNLEMEEFKQIFERIAVADVLECLKEKNSSKETPLHMAAKHSKRSFEEAVLDLGEDQPSKMEQLLTEKDENSNTPLHLATQSKRTDASPLLKYVKTQTREPIKYLNMKNIFGWTPFSGAVAIGDIEVVKQMLQGLTKEEKRSIVNQADFSNASPLHVSAKQGHVDVFNLLLQNGAEITRRGPDQQTALDVAIDADQRGIILTVIKGEHWKEAFQVPSTSPKGLLDTPLRKLIRRFPDLAEEFLDNCYETETNQEDFDGDDVIKMNFDFIEDTHSYRFAKGKERQETQFCRRDEEGPIKDKFKFKDYEVQINNHPLMIMANERKVDLLQHPLSLAITLRKWNMYGRKFYFFQIGFYVLFLLALNLFILTSKTPIDDSSHKYNCTLFFRNRNVSKEDSNEQSSSKEEQSYSDWLNEENNTFRSFLLLLNITRVILFFFNREFKPIWGQFKNIHWKRPKLPVVFLFDALVYSLAIFTACHSFIFSEISCFKTQLCAVTITLAWINLLLHMRLLYGIGKYVILFQDVIFTFFAVSIVFIILITGFAFSFHILLSERQEFLSPHDAMLKTLIMMSGEIEYGEIFFKDNPPKGFGDKWDQDWEKVPFPFMTYGMFIIFFFSVSIVALNVLVGLTVDDIRNFLNNADLRKLTMRLKFILQMERHSAQKRQKKPLNKCIKKSPNFEMPATSDLISKARIWEKIAKKQEDSRKRGEAEEERRSMKELIHQQTMKLKAMINKRGKLSVRRARDERDENRQPKFSTMSMSTFNRKESSISTFNRRESGWINVDHSLSLENEEDEFGELFNNVRSIMAHVEKRSDTEEELSKMRSEIETIKKMITDMRSELLSDLTSDA